MEQTSAVGLGCVKTLEDSRQPKEENQTCGVGEYFMRKRPFI
jgi:hypothetical protein